MRVHVALIYEHPSPSVPRSVKSAPCSRPGAESGASSLPRLGGRRSGASARAITTLAILTYSARDRRHQELATPGQLLGSYWNGQPAYARSDRC